MKRAALGSVLGGAALISILTVVARAAGFARWAVFSPAVGSTAVGSAYTAANALPNVLFEITVGGALAGVVVPLTARALEQRSMGRVNQIASALLTWTLTVTVPLAAVLALAAKPLAGLLLDGAVEAANPGAVDAAAALLVMFAAQLPLYGFGLVAGGLLQAGKRFFWPALAPLVSSLWVIAVYVVFASMAGGHQNQPQALPAAALGWLGWGTTGGVALLTLPLLVPLMRQGVRFRWTYRFGEGAGKRARGLAGAGLGSLMAQQLSIVAVVFLASNRGGVGTLPLYHYAQAVYLLPYAVLVVPLATAAFPHLAAASERRTVLQAVSASTVRLVVATSLAGAAALVAAAPAVEALFGAVDRSGGAAGLGSAVAWFAPGLVGFGLMTVLMRVLYAADHPRVAVAGAALGWLMVAVASVVLTLCLTRNGPNVAATLTALAAASAIGMTVGGLALAAGVKRALGPETLAGLGRTLLVLGIGAAVGGAAGWLVAVQFAHSGAWVALIGGLAGPLVALGAIGLATLGDASLKPAIAQLRSHGLEEAP